MYVFPVHLSQVIPGWWIIFNPYKVETLFKLSSHINRPEVRQQFQRWWGSLSRGKECWGQ